jgi:hypothetical protein
VSDTSRGIERLSWRLRVYEGEYLKYCATLPLVIEITGQIIHESGTSIDTESAQHWLHEVVADLNERSAAGHPMQPFALVGDFMTISIEELQFDGIAASRMIARLDMVRDEERVSGSLLAVRQPRIDLDPVKIEPSDGVLDVFLRLLAFMMH